MKLKKDQIIKKMQNGYVLCKLQSFYTSYYLWNGSDGWGGSTIFNIDQRSISTIIKMCKVDSNGKYELQEIFK